MSAPMREAQPRPGLARPGPAALGTLQPLWVLPALDGASSPFPLHTCGLEACQVRALSAATGPLFPLHRLRLVCCAPHRNAAPTRSPPAPARSPSQPCPLLLAVTRGPCGPGPGSGPFSKCQSLVAPWCSLAGAVGVPGPEVSPAPTGWRSACRQSRRDGAEGTGGPWAPTAGLAGAGGRPARSALAIPLEQHPSMGSRTGCGHIAAPHCVLSYPLPDFCFRQQRVVSPPAEHQRYLCPFHRKK